MGHLGSFWPYWRWVYRYCIPWIAFLAVFYIWIFLYLSKKKPLLPFARKTLMPPQKHLLGRIGKDLRDTKPHKLRSTRSSLFAHETLITQCSSITNNLTCRKNSLPYQLASKESHLEGTFEHQSYSSFSFQWVALTILIQFSDARSFYLLYPLWPILIYKKEEEKKVKNNYL